ncbi:MAG TPA: PQQ-dependent sugar dehydrogenase [Pyrinomonadaceae bacterium]|nr:PQQ-dependent sugar dehydrogenase [Pyrinomonadaceae bacterium]
MSAHWSASAATLPSGFTEVQVASGLSNPTAMALAPDGRLFVCQQEGQLRVIKNGALLSTPFLTVTVSSTGERGLLGVAFDPNFSTNQYVYVYYTATTPAIHNRVSRFTANGDVALAGSELVILDLDNLSSATNHNGGAMHFGPDGKLYIAVGDNANSSNSQTLNNLLGKMLRINTDGSIPTDNPFYGTATGKNRAIWTLGLRNPYTFAFQPGTGRMFINDVGQNSWEEINDGIAGSNYGWPTCEGFCSPPNPNFRDPLFAYGHGSSSTTGCAITGGAFYNPQTIQFPSSYVGKYFFADFCSGWIRLFDPSNGTATGFATGISNPVDLRVAADGSLYYLARGAGAVFKVQYPANQVPPSISVHPSNKTVAEGQTATFSVSATGSTPLSYQWQRNGVNINGATSSSYTTPPVTSSDNNAQFRCVVSNAFGSVNSNSATLTVTSNTQPTGNITSPVAGTMYNAGDTINYSGTASDTEDGSLPASAFTWQVDFHHDTHVHPFIAATSGATSGSFTIPTVGETSANVWYRIHLTVRDSGGLTHSSFRDVLPRTVTLTLASNPAGLQITLDGQPHTTPYAETNVVGMTRTLGVVSPQTKDGVTYNFASWSDGGSATHPISIPSNDATYTAVFARPANPGDVIISEFRFSGPNGTNDEFVELFNKTDSDIIVASTDNTSGWMVAALATGESIVNDAITIANGTVIPARGHYLATCSLNSSNSGSYGLNAYAAGDTTYTQEIGNETGIALFTTTNFNNFNSATRLDAVGFTTADPLYREGAGLTPGGGIASSAEYSLVRKVSLTTGLPQDTGDNAADFVLVATDGNATLPAAIIGAPGPENLSSPRISSSVTPSLVDPLQCSGCPPNQVRLFCGNAGTPPCDSNTSSLGFLTIRRKFTNNTGSRIARLRFRIVDITNITNTGGLEPPVADLRAVTSNATTISTSVEGTVTVEGTTLEMPPAQTIGGGINSSLAAATITLANPLPATGSFEQRSINLQFLLGVKALGRFRFFIVVEALPESAGTASRTRLCSEAGPRLVGGKHSRAAPVCQDR